VTDPAQISAEGDVARARGERIVLVPTMGALHAGHVALLDEGRQRGDRLVLSIFVNPTQFGPKEDLAKYPRPVEADLEKAALAGVDVVFMPTAAAMYPAGYQTFVEVRELQQGLCGEVRPGHFVGVATVVCKLFTIVRPHLAVFGEKDFQQLAVITRMTADLNLGVQILPWPTVREPDGLAMSSRNAYLSPSERARAVALSQGLRAAESAAAAGERSATSLIKVAHSIIAPAVDRIDYLELRDAANLAPLSSLSVDGVILVAAFIGTTRLIDNLRLRPTPSHTE
jgi:pantoate--beta-alanine ligase